MRRGASSLDMRAVHPDREGVIARKRVIGPVPVGPLQSVGRLSAIIRSRCRLRPFRDPHDPFKSGARDVFSRGD